MCPLRSEENSELSARQMEQFGAKFWGNFVLISSYFCFQRKLLLVLVDKWVWAPEKLRKFLKYKVNSDKAI